jgi:hypothetical protein
MPIIRFRARIVPFKCALLALAWMLVSGCGSQDYRADLDASVREFHERYDAREFVEIHSSASFTYRSATTQPATVARLGDWYAKFGPVKSTELERFRAKWGSSSMIVVATYCTRFAKRLGTEYLVFRYDGNGPELELLAYDREYRSERLPCVRIAE